VAAVKSYLLLWFGFTAALLLAAAGFNWLVDPYGVHGSPSRPGWNLIKPSAVQQAHLGQAFRVARVAPQTLVMGNSRAQVGFDPEHVAWPETARPVFNLSLPGTDIGVALQYLRHAIALAQQEKRAPPRLVVLGVDILDFLPAVQVPAKAGSELSPSGAHGAPAPIAQGGDLRQSKTQLESLFSLSALMDSAATVLAQRDPFASHLTNLGFNTMRNYERLAGNEGYRQLFDNKDRSHMVTLAYRARDKALLAAAKTPLPLAWDARADLQAVLDLCQQHRIELRLVVYPYHALFLQSLWQAGLWPEFDAWKRELAQLSHAPSAQAQPAITVWDFAQYNEATSEAVPAAGDTQTQMRWFWEAGHFKRELGDRVLARILAPAPEDDHFGSRLTPASVDAILARGHVAGQAYRSAHAQEIERLRLLWLNQAQRSGVAVVPGP
jgi:hypothetical protein